MRTSKVRLAQTGRHVVEHRASAGLTAPRPRRKRTPAAPRRACAPSAMVSTTTGVPRNCILQALLLARHRRLVRQADGRRGPWHSPLSSGRKHAASRGKVASVAWCRASIVPSLRLRAVQGPALNCASLEERCNGDPRRQARDGCSRTHSSGPASNGAHPRRLVLRRFAGEPRPAGRKTHIARSPCPLTLPDLFLRRCACPASSRC